MAIQKNIKPLVSHQSLKATIDVDTSLNECASMVLDSSKERWEKQLENAYKIFVSTRLKNIIYQLCSCGLFVSTTIFGGFLGKIINLCNDDCNQVSHVTSLYACTFLALILLFKYGKDKSTPNYDMIKHEISMVLDEIKQTKTEKEEE